MSIQTTIKKKLPISKQIVLSRMSKEKPKPKMNQPKTLGSRFT